MPAVVLAVEIEQTVERSGDLIEGAAFGNGFRGRIDPAETEVILDEAQYGGLIRYRMIDIIAACKGRDHEQG